MKITKDYVFFWTGKDIYSNFYSYEFAHAGRVFKWAEQAIMYRKAMLFGAHQIAKEIMKAKTPADCKKLGRSREIPFDNEIWEKQKLTIFKEILFDKFKNQPMKDAILSTGDKELVEASPYDKIWGIGLSADDPACLDKTKWKGLNLLGQVLVDVRNELRNQKI